MKSKSDKPDIDQESDEKPVSLSAKVQKAFEYMAEGDPIDTAASRVGVSHRYLKEMYYLHRRYAENVLDRSKNDKVVKQILTLVNTKGITQVEACVMAEVPLSTFQRYYRDYRKRNKK